MQGLGKGMEVDKGWPMGKEGHVGRGQRFTVWGCQGERLPATLFTHRSLCALSTLPTYALVHP